MKRKGQRSIKDVWKEQDRLVSESAELILSRSEGSLAEKYLGWKSDGKIPDVAPAGIWRLMGGVCEDNPSFDVVSFVANMRCIFPDGSSVVAGEGGYALGHGRLCWCLGRAHNLDCVGYHSQMEGWLNHHFARLKLDLRLAALVLDAAVLYWGDKRTICPAESLRRLCSELGTASTEFVWNQVVKMSCMGLL